MAHVKDDQNGDERAPHDGAGGDEGEGGDGGHEGGAGGAVGGGKRARKARQTRRRMLDAARTLFVEHGYGATNLRDIAARADVAVQTLYFTFGNKRTVLKELVDVSVAGDEAPVATMDRAWFQQAIAADTAQEQLRVHIDGVRQIMERTAPVIEVLRAATASEPEIDTLWQRVLEQRLTVQREAAKSLTAKPGARQGLSAEHAADVLFALLSPELYLLLVRDRAWSPDVWQSWVHELLRPQLCA